MKLSEAVQLGLLLERPGSPFSFKSCAIGVAMAAVGIEKKQRSAQKARELWPWLNQQAGRSFFGRKVDCAEAISDWYFNVKLGRMTMPALLAKIQKIEPAEQSQPTTQTISVA